MSASKYIGRSIPRRDARLKATGEATYTADLVLPNMLHAAVLRSPHAHARIRSINVAGARASRGVAAVFTHADLGSSGKEIPLLQPNPVLTPRTQLLLAKEELNRVWVLRKVLTPLSPSEAMELLLSKMGKTKTNGEFLAAMASGKS